MAKLIVLTGNDAGYEFPLADGETTIGRGLETSICLMDKRCSRYHCRVFSRDGTYTIEDLRSRNGTFLNGHQTSGRQELKPGDHIRLGKSMLELSEASMNKQKEAPPATVRQAEITIENNDDADDLLDEPTLSIAHFFRKLVGAKTPAAKPPATKSGRK